MSKKGYKIRFVTNDDIYLMERKTHPSAMLWVGSSLQVLDNLDRVRYILYGTEKQMLVSKQFSYHLFYFNSISTTRDKVKSTITGRITSILCNNYTMSVGSTFRAIKTNLETGKSDGIVTYYCNTISKKNKQFFINISKQKTK